MRTAEANGEGREQRQSHEPQMQDTITAATNRKTAAEILREEHSLAQAWRRKETVDCLGWLAKAREKGLTAAPEAEEFSEINEYIEAKMAWRAEMEKRKHNQNATTHSREKATTNRTSNEEVQEQEDELMLEAAGDEEGRGTSQRPDSQEMGQGVRGARQGTDNEAT